MKGELTMKQTIRRPNVLLRAWEKGLEAISDRPQRRTAAACAAYAAAAFVLAGGGWLNRPLPMAVCLVAIAPSGPPALAALIGALVGYPVFWGLYTGLEGMAAAILVFACLRIFAPTLSAARPWFQPAVCAGMTALIGGVFLLANGLSAALTALWCANALLSCVGTIAFRCALDDRNKWAELFFGVCLIVGLAAVRLPAGMTLGAVVAAVASVCAAGTTMGAVIAGVCGAALDLSLGSGGAAAAAFLLAGVLCLAIPVRRGAMRALMFTVSVAAGIAVTGGSAWALVPSTALGAVLSIPIPAVLFRGTQVMQEQQPSMRARLNDAAGTLDLLGAFLQQPNRRTPPKDAAVIFDRTADEICRCCGGYDRCWEHNAQQTYRLLSEAAPRILEHGMAQRGDFSPEFRCCRMDSFLRTLNCEIDELRLRRLCQARADQARECAREQYAVLASFLRASAQSLKTGSARPDRFRCELGAASAGKTGRAETGDRCACVRGPEHRFYVLLCDGMGTGTAAGEESQHAVAVLTGLLRTGTPAPEAISMLDAACTLRADGGFATIDLFEVDLLTGETALYKQGAAPSYYRKGRRVGQVGTATAPPGYAAGNGRQAMRYDLSLGREDLLVMVSDGVIGEAAARCLAEWSAGDADELARELIASAPGDDDAMAVVIRVRPCIRL